MKTQALINTATAMLAEGKGLLAMDESTGTCNQRFASAGIPQTVEYRRAYRELLITTAGLNEYVSGAILFDETIHQCRADGMSFIKTLAAANIVPGIKVDLGTTEIPAFPGEKVSAGLDGLRARLSIYFDLGARFAKWRAVIAIGDGLPSRACIEANAQALARYAALCQEAGLLPIVEPEVLMDGAHSMARCSEVTQAVLHEVFEQLYRQRVLFEGMILKPNMIVPGLACPTQESVDEIAEATVQCLRRAVPAAVPGIAFLSGGQSSELASARLNAMQVRFNTPEKRTPWALSFSFGRALQAEALHAWAGVDANREKAQAALLHRARCNSAALRGKYAVGMERASTPSGSI